MRWNPFRKKSRRMSRALVAAVLIASTVATAPVLVSAQDGTIEADAPVLVSAQDGTTEADGGDFSNDPANPTSVGLNIGSNVLSGAVLGGDAADLDYVTITVPEGHELATADLISYESDGNSVSFIGVQAGSTFTETADNPNPANLLGLLLFGDGNVGSDILAPLGEGVNPFGGDNAIGFEGALAAGDYTFWIQETSPNEAAYSIDLVVAPVAAAPAPPSDDAPAAPEFDPPAEENPTTNIDLEFAGLEALGAGFVYEGWVIIDGAPVSTGRFVIEADGSLTLLTSSLADDVSAATTVVITIEPAVDPDPGPADPKPLAGDIVDGVAELSIGHPAAIGDDFSSAGGSFFVATPTTESLDDEFSGVWFLNPPSDGQPPTAALDIPQLPAGWVYEGWVVIDGQPVSTGRFLDAAGPDDFGGFSGPLPAPPFPGEDFIVNAPDGLEFPLDLRGNGTVVLTIEPADDDSPAPFAMRPLAAPVPADLEFHGSVELGAGPGVPSGTATLILPPPPPSTNVGLEFAGLEPLGEGFVYEGWVIIDGAPVSTGRFNVEADGSLTFLTGSLAEDVSEATAVVITIEPAVDPDPGPADPKPLAGDVVDGVAQLTTAHPAALGTDFADAGGNFLVATPTTETTDDEYSGVWFLEITDDGPVAGLDIPELPAGWVYEGWVVIDGQPVTTGRFLDPAAPDDFGGFSGPLGNPPFPGEDFIVNAPDGLSFPTDLRGQTVVLTVEPADDDSPAPFAIRPLIQGIPEGLEVPGPVSFEGAGRALPTGVATLEGAAPAPAPDPVDDAPAPAPAPEDDAPAPAPEDDAPAPAPAPAPEADAPVHVEFVNNEFGPRYLEVQPNVNVYSSNQSNTATEFILHPQGGGVYLIQSVSTGLYLHGHGEGGGYNVDVVGPVDDTAYWMLVEADGGYHVVNVGLGQPLQAVRPGFNVNTTAPADGLGAAITWTVVPAE